MSDSAVTPSVAVSIGRQTRVYHAFITSAPASLDAPSTMTLYAGGLTDVVGFAAMPVTVDARRARATGRLVLVNTTELGWQRARYREAQHLFVPTDPVLVGLNALQHWLWHRLKMSSATELHP